MGSNELWWCWGQVQAYCPPWRPHAMLFSDFKTNKQTKTKSAKSGPEYKRNGPAVWGREADTLRLCCLVSALADSLIGAGPAPPHLVNPTGCETQGMRERRFSLRFSSDSRRKFVMGKTGPSSLEVGTSEGWVQVGCRGKDCWRGRGLEALGLKPQFPTPSCQVKIGLHP